MQGAPECATADVAGRGVGGVVDTPTVMLVGGQHVTHVSPECADCVRFFLVSNNHVLLVLVLLTNGKTHPLTTP